MNTKQAEAPVVVPDGVEYVEPEVRQLAAGIAADIRKHGHWQDGHDVQVGGVCIVLSPSFKAFDSIGGTRPWIDRLTSLLCGYVFNLEEMYNPVFKWNDSHPTPVVLARLDAIAEGLVER